MRLRGEKRDRGIKFIGCAPRGSPIKIQKQFLIGGGV